MNREQIAALIVGRLQASKAEIASEFQLPGRIQSAVIDDLLPHKAAQEIAKKFPPSSAMRERKSLREPISVMRQVR